MQQWLHNRCWIDESFTNRELSLDIPGRQWPCVIQHAYNVEILSSGNALDIVEPRKKQERAKIYFKLKTGNFVFETGETLQKIVACCSWLRDNNLGYVPVFFSLLWLASNHHFWQNETKLKKLNSWNWDISLQFEGLKVQHFFIVSRLQVFWIIKGFCIELWSFQ